MKTAIIIPARYGSTRLPGKPLAMIRGQTMLQRVVRLSQAAALGIEGVSILVATDDKRILQHCGELGVNAVMTAPELLTGTDRVASAVQQLTEQPDFILNMQGDAPLTPPHVLRSMIHAFAADPCDCITPVTQLTWEALDQLRQNKTATPFTGTTAVFDAQTGRAFWFSKQILPAIRNEAHCRQIDAKSPVFLHLGLYGYSLDLLKQYTCLPQSQFERLEGLEQLRLLEHGVTIRCIPVEFKHQANLSGIDSPQDIARMERLIDTNGEMRSADNPQQDLIK